MDFKIRHLTKLNLVHWASHFLAIDQDTSGERWGLAEFQLDLPGKWDYSRLAFERHQLAGFLIASTRLNAIHIHRLAVSRINRRQGLGRQLIADLRLAASIDGLNQMTLKVRFDNTAARRFYERLGFAQTAVSGDNILLALPLSRSQLGNKWSDANGFR